MGTKYPPPPLPLLPDELWPWLNPTLPFGPDPDDQEDLALWSDFTLGDVEAEETYRRGERPTREDVAWFGPDYADGQAIPEVRIIPYHHAPDVLEALDGEHDQPLVVEEVLRRAS